ncbi:MAG: bifunctional (p)ppGpp synthetase/guanosine-3',5'-bis(diphosphate) 3'-pyrophosphohydrolase [Fimbriimonas ginsengisoli]|uniref:Bifunctional (P)ppGpp synthetase/guanosine-3',5'-bis(Diphosphate) 3'-pyrophosphohydrolase n=1 Tax=Fimbriimonas ginsengisoli TaxID=1005039 RepID=A0A931LT15_FIMGI|nr:bifunctional (p)ppGpp synthetase/guanosine-3',5'-bis(diphosphate) 3'-pyrophosphohydrolase [Fimbriimonas ginsengisoli]
MAVPYEISHEWEEPDGLHDLLQAIREQRDDADVRRIRYAYYLAEKAHAGQTRQSGEAYILHPLAVAAILVDLHMDDDTIVAALLHDVIEDSPHTVEDLAETFGEDVANLVEGMTKLKLKGSSELSPRQRAAAETTRTAESLRKMLLAMAKDFRVMVIKLADRLHNMQTLEVLPPEKQIRIANETLDVYAPLAGRLGIWQIKWQLEDLAFKFLHPDEYREVEELVKHSRKDREKELSQAILALKDRLEKRGVIGAEVQGRPKHLFSIFNKMAKQGLEFHEIYDLLGLRLIVPSRSDCYIALGIVHDLWVPIPGLFFDYIATPKPNGYQSLHTKVVGPGGTPIEVQIRTREMHEVAEYGIAAHWSYKEGKLALDESTRLQQLREQLFDWSSDARTSSDFLRSISTDLFAEQVFVFTPKGDVLDLPTNSTPVDFAFRVHTQLGMTLVGAKVNGALVPLGTALKNGDVVEIITRSNAQPSLDWLEFVRSAHARAKLRAHFRKLSRTEDAAHGKETLDKELKALGLDPRQFLGEDRLDQLAEQFDGCDNGSDLLAKVGAGLISVQTVLQKMRGIAGQVQEADQIHLSRTKEGKVQLVTSGLESVMVHRAKCCSPIPGDEVVGYVTRGRGLMIHRKVCPNAVSFLSSEPDRLLPYEWAPDGRSYAVGLKIVSVNRQGLLMDVSTIFGESNANVSAARIRTLPNQTAEIEAVIDVTDTRHLASIMTKISNFSDVISIFRLFGRSAAR